MTLVLLKRHDITFFIIFKRLFFFNTVEPLLSWLHKVIIYGVACASGMLLMVFLHSLSHLVVSNLLHVISSDYIVFCCHLC